MVETRETKTKIQESLDRIQLIENQEVFSRKLEYISEICRNKINELKKQK
ncbi:MAG: hypothetical protein AABW41_03070 [Nanoarchaeota archaeon]